jgi:putative endonuclease
VRTERTRRGDAGEKHVRAILEACNWRWIASNWRCPAGELDLVMRDQEMIVVVEVKVRRGVSRGAAEEAITAAKARKLLATGEWFMADHFPDGKTPWRIDLFAITLDEMNRVARRTHVENAVIAG